MALKFILATLAGAAFVAQAAAAGGPGTRGPVDSIGQCGGDMAYVDGGLYCRQADIPNAACTSWLGDFPGDLNFRARFGLNRNNGSGYDELRLAKENGGPYIVYDDLMVIDMTPNAREPVQIKDQSKVKSGEVTGYWAVSYSALYWVSSRDGTSSRGPVGFTLVDVPGYKGLKQLYWDQALYERVASGQQYADWGLNCYGVYGSTIEYRAHPL